MKKCYQAYFYTEYNFDIIKDRIEDHFFLYETKEEALKYPESKMGLFKITIEKETKPE